MNEMSTNNRDYDNRYYDDAFYGNRESYRDDYRYNNRDNYREDYRDYDNIDSYRENYRNYRDYDNKADYRDSYRRRDYDRRGGKINNRNYREQDYFEEIEMIMEDMREQYRKIEDIAEMAHNQQDKNMLMKIAQKEKENYNYIKQIVEK